MRTCFGIGEPGDPQFTISAAHSHGVCYEQIDDFITPHPDRVFQNTGHGWWTESTVCQTRRTPCGGDAPKANLIVEEIDDGR